MNIPIYNCLLNDDELDTGIYAMSFVDCPANESDFVALAKQAKQSTEVYLNRNTYKQVLTGVILKPEQLIYRSNLEMGEHYFRKQSLSNS